MLGLQESLIIFIKYCVSEYACMYCDDYVHTDDLSIYIINISAHLLVITKYIIQNNSTHMRLIIEPHTLA